MDKRTAQMLAKNLQKAEYAPPPPPPPKGLAKAAKTASTWVSVHRLAVKVGSGAVILVAFVAYYEFVAKPAQGREKVALEAIAVERLRAETATRQVAQDECLNKAQTESETTWNATCKKYGRRAACTLPARVTDDLERREAEARNACLMKYSITAQ